LPASGDHVFATIDAGFAKDDSLSNVRQIVSNAEITHLHYITLHCIIYMKEAENGRVLSLVLNDRRPLDDVTSDGELFQVLAAVTWNARSLIVESRVSGTTSAEVDDERRCC